MDLSKFVADWINHGYERGEAHSYWLGLIRDLFSLDRPEDWIVFEDQINGKFIDARIPSTRVLIEQKSIGRDLDAAFEQAKDYDNELPFDRKSRWIVCCDFQSFRIYDMNQPRPTPEIVLLKDLPREAHRLKFLIDENAVRIKRELDLSLQAGELVGKLYDAFAKSYTDPNSIEAQTSLNKLCVRLVFCLYAEDAGIFDKHIFSDYLGSFPTQRLRRALIDLFEVLNTPKDRRDRYLEAELQAFPYVNGKLFEDDDIEIPNFNDESRYQLLTKAASFNWSGISPTIFGALFESTLNSSTRRSGGMHYTSLENIHKVIDPLFLDDLRAELEQCGSNRKKLVALQSKLGHLTFFDPACGSGNFLTETYLSLRRLENKILERLQGGAIKLGAIDDPIQVTIDQFFGIELNDFAVAVARTALWIAEHQMLRESAAIIHREIDFLPIKTNAHIVEGNALRLDWNSISPRGVNYIIGNPPFIGASMMSATQKSELVAILGKGKLVNSVDYVGGWFHKAVEFMIGTETRAAFVATNSITQGEQVAPLWRKLLNEYGAHIDFAWRSFRWANEIKNSAAVTCVVIGFSVAPNTRPKIIFDSDRTTVATNINPYLVDAPNIMIESRSKPICADAPRMTHGNKASDGGNLILTRAARDQLLKTNPMLAVCIRQYLVAKDFINGGCRYCLWLKDIEPSVYRHSQEIMRRLDAVQKFRAASTAKPTREMAKRPFLFFNAPQTNDDYLCVPAVSSERREYIPIGFMDRSIIVSDAVLIIPNATLYHFGVLTSSVHMNWTRRVCGRLESRYHYSTSVVYNNFPWCSPTDDQRQAIERSARRILDVRSKHEGSTLADLYDELTMPDDLRRAHAENDRAVMDAYGFDRSLSESEIVARLMSMYERLPNG